MDGLLEKLWNFVARDAPLTFQVRIFRLFCLATSILCLGVVMPVNLLQNLPLVINLANVVLGLFALFCYWDSRRGRNHILLFFLVAGLMLDPAWFFNGGADGPITYFFFPMALYPMSLFRGKARWIAVTGLMLDTCALLIIDYFWPALVTPYHAPSDRLWDLVTGVFCTFVALTVVIWVVIANYDWERNLLSRYAKDLGVSEANYRGVVENAKSIILRVDQQGRVRFFNKFAEELFGYKRDEIISRHLVGTIIPPVSTKGENLTVMVEQILRQPERQPQIESENVCRDGRRLQIIWTYQPIYEDSHELREILCVGADVTERKQAEENLERINRQLVEISHQAGMAEVAVSVLHNVGNVLNSANISASIIADSARKSRLGDLQQLSELINQHSLDLGRFLTEDERGRKIPAYLHQLAQHQLRCQERQLKETKSLIISIEHIKEIVATQQSSTRVLGLLETLSLAGLVEDSLRMIGVSLEEHNIRLVRDYHAIPPVTLDKHKTLQILINLLRNAQHACDVSRDPVKQITIRITPKEDEHVAIEVEDNGIGIAPENLTRIFSYGFTTRKDGHGFGLHAGALAAKQMGGSLSVHSAGPGKGARFTLNLPFRAQPHSKVFSAPGGAV